MNLRCNWRVLSLLVSPCVLPAQAQCGATTRQIDFTSPRERLGELTAPSSSSGDLLADGAWCSHVARLDSGARLRLRLVSPVLNVVDQGGIADPRSNGPMWTGRGISILARGGFAADLGPFHAVVAPELSWAENRPFAFIPASDTARNPFSSPFYLGPDAIDLPSRFGDAPVTTVALGQSEIWLTAGPVELGFSASGQDWGPGLRGNLLLSRDAPGIPRAFARTAHPIDTPIGSWTGTAFIGTLTESRFFDDDPRNDLRTFAAEAVEWRPSDSSDIALGFMNADMVDGALSSVQGRREPIAEATNQMVSMFAQFRAPDAGARAWVEVALRGPFPTARELATVPYQGIVYLVGFDRRVTGARGSFLLSAEAADLEQPTDIRGVAQTDFYTSVNIPQGWTQRGQLLGYGTGPGSQSQWLSGDWITPTWSLGLFGERVRWNEDALFRQYAPYSNRHDVTIRAGIRSGIIRYSRELSLELGVGERLNYLFQDDAFLPGYRTVDVFVPDLRFTITPGSPSVK